MLTSALSVERQVSNDVKEPAFARELSLKAVTLSSSSGEESDITTSKMAQSPKVTISVPSSNTTSCIVSGGGKDFNTDTNSVHKSSCGKTKMFSSALTDISSFYKI